MYLETTQTFYKRIQAGDVTPAEIQEAYQDFFAHLDEIRQEINKTFTVAALKKKLQRPYDKKAQYVEAYLHDLAQCYTAPAGGMISYTWGETIWDGMKSEIEKITPESIAQYAAKVAERRAKIDRSLKAPETLDEYQLFIRVWGYEKLSYDQQVEYDALLWVKSSEDRKRREEWEARVSRLPDSVTFEMEEDFHTKKNVPIWVVKMSDRVEREVYRQIAETVDKCGGFWSRFNGGFVFWEQVDAENFLSLQEGAGDVLDRWERIEAWREDKVAARLLEYSERHHLNAEESLFRERLQNTVRRAMMAAHAEINARNEIAFAKTIENLMEALSEGKLDALKRIRFAVDVGLLYGLLDRAWTDANWKEVGRYLSRDERRPLKIEDIIFAKFPFGHYHLSDLVALREAVQGKRGIKYHASRLEALIAFCRKHQKDFIALQDIEDSRAMVKLSQKLRDRDRLYERIAGPVKDAQRLEKMGITSIFTLRYALREFWLHFVSPEGPDPLREALRALVGRKLPGFFPTPPSTARYVIDKAQIIPGMRCLEPSAGTGNLADPMAEITGVHPDVYEVQPALREILRLKGYDLQGSDFLKAHPADTGLYERIVMNPAFEDHQDIIQIRHAFTFLEADGILVAITSESAWTNQDRVAKEFRAWFDDLEAQGCAHQEKLPGGSFLESGTGTNTRVLFIQRCD